PNEKGQVNRRLNSECSFVADLTSSFTTKPNLHNQEDVLCQYREALRPQQCRHGYGYRAGKSDTPLSATPFPRARASAYRLASACGMHISGSIYPNVRC